VRDRRWLHVRPLPHDEARPGHLDRCRLWLFLADDLLEGRGCLIVLERGAVALHVGVAKGMELIDELVVRELDSMLLQLLAELVDPLLRHCPHS
jgi:hypothetical protein